MITTSFMRKETSNRNYVDFWTRTKSNKLVSGSTFDMIQDNNQLYSFMNTQRKI